MAVHQIALGADVAEIPRLIAWVEQVMAAAGVGGSPIFKITLALEEAVMNVINHAFDDVAGPHRIALSLSVAAGRVIAELTDNGRAFDPASMPEPDIAAPLAERAVGGMGLHLIRTMLDRVEYRREDGQNRLVMEKELA